MPNNLKSKSFILSVFTAICSFHSFTQSLPPQQGREIIGLNKEWQFAKSPDAGDTSGQHPLHWLHINIPHTWNDTDMQNGGKFYAGEAIYKRELVTDNSWKNKRAFIRFEGVGQVADLYVNNKFIGEHKGSYAAFCFEITYALRYDTVNSIVVKVNNSPRKDIVPINNFLFPIYGGIYRPVSLIVTNKLNITTTDYASPGIYISQKEVSPRAASLQIKVKLENTRPDTRSIRFQTALYDQGGRLIRTGDQWIKVFAQGRQTFSQAMEIRAPRLWNGRQDPYLYKLIVRIWDRDTMLDEVQQPVGIRNLSLVPGKGFFLNGKPYRLYGVCRHQDILGYGNALSDQQHDTDMALIKEIGATSIRFGHYQQAERVYNDCDSAGFLVWTEIPFVNAVSGEEAENTQQQLRELIRQNYNHPSIYTWGLCNEVYCKTPEDYLAQLIRTLNDLAKSEDPDRFTASTNGYGSIGRPENLNTDIQGINRYYGWYEGKMNDLEKWVSDAGKKYPNINVMLAEYGAEANTRQQSEIVPEDPPKYDGQFFPESYQTELHKVQWGIIRRHPYLISSYVWNMFDFATPLWNRGNIPGRNLKGLITFDRKTKKDAFYWYKANWSQEPVLYIAGRRDSIRNNSTTNISVFSNISAPDLYVNGHKMPPAKEGTTPVDHIFENIHLAKGANIIKAVAHKNGSTFEDTIEWQNISPPSLIYHATYPSCNNRS